MPNKINFKYLCKLKASMKKFSIKEEELRRELDVCLDKKRFESLQKELDQHLSSFAELENALVEEEAKMINIERGLYKGVAINIEDKTYKKFPLYFKFGNLNNHVGYTGTTRVGKSKNMISDINQLIKAGWDLFIIDPKGGEGQEILTETIQSALAAKRPEDFMYLSPAFVNESEHANLLYGMGDDEAASLIKTFAASISDDGFFTSVVYENTLAVLKSLTFIQNATDPSGEYTKMLEEKEIEKYISLKNLKDGSEKILFDRWNKASSPNELHVSTKKMKKTKGFEFKTLEPSVSLYQNRSMITLQILSCYTTFESFEDLQKMIKSFITVPPPEKIGIEKYTQILRLRAEALSILEKVLSTDKANFSKISKTHSVLLSQLAYDNIGEVFSGTGINPIANRLLSTEDKGLICVMQPFPMRFKTVSNISVMAILKTIESMMGLVGVSGRSNKRRLAILIDEAGAVMYEGIEELFNKAGGLGVTMFVYTQSYEDYALTIGPSNANVVMDNVNTVITMRMNHLKSCKEAAEKLGTIRKHQSAYMSSTSGMGRFSIGNEDEAIAESSDIENMYTAVGYVKHNGNTYKVDFPYVRGIKNSPIEMPTLDNERNMRYLAEYETKMSNIFKEENLHD